MNHITKALVYLLRLSQNRELLCNDNGALKADDIFSSISLSDTQDSDGRELFLSLSGKDWEDLFSLCCLQGVEAMAFDALSVIKHDEKFFLKLNLGRDLFFEWMSATFDVETDYLKKKKAISKLSSLYASHGYRMMLLKGYGLSLNYAVEKHRSSGDIDIYLFGKQREADKALSRDGIEICNDVHHHTTFFFQGIHVENHFDFVNIQAHFSNRRLEKILKRLSTLENETISVLGETVCLPNAQLNALFLIRHMAMHFAAEKIILRHIMDWACFIRKYDCKIDWMELIKILRRENMDRFLAIVNRLAFLFTGFRSVAMEDTVKVDEALFERVLGDIIHPEWNEQHPLTRNPFKIFIYRFRRWRAGSWKHRIVYTESLCLTFIMQVFSHLYKPKTFFR